METMPLDWRDVMPSSEGGLGTCHLMEKKFGFIHSASSSFINKKKSQSLS
jgi:hypothetical protein